MSYPPVTAALPTVTLPVFPSATFPPLPTGTDASDPFSFDLSSFTDLLSSLTAIFPIPSVTVVTIRPGATAAPDVTVEKKNSLNVGALVGGVAGGLVVLAAASVALFFCLRRRRRLAAQSDLSDLYKPAVASEDPYLPVPMHSPKFVEAAAEQPPSTPALSRPGLSDEGIEVVQRLVQQNVPADTLKTVINTMMVSQQAGPSQAEGSTALPPAVPQAIPQMPDDPPPAYAPMENA